MFVTHSGDSLLWKSGFRPASITHVPHLPCLTHDQLADHFRKATYRVSGEPSAAQLLLCEHPFSVTVGRHGSIRDVRHFPHKAVQYVGRGGTAYPHGAGQLGIYPVFPLDSWKISAAEHVARLLRVAQTVALQYDVPTTVSAGDARVYVGSRCLAATGIAVHRGVSSYGLILNVNPDLEMLSIVRINDRPMTSLVRESPIRVPESNVPNIVLDAVARLYPEFSPHVSIGSPDATC